MGVLILNNFSQKKSDEPAGALLKIMKYYIMPLYGMTLKKHIEEEPSTIQKHLNILNVGIQFISII